MNPEGRFRVTGYLAALALTGMASQIAAQDQTSYGDGLPSGLSVDARQHRFDARERRVELRQSQSGLAKAKRARSRL